MDAKLVIATKPQDVEEETRYGTLNTNGFVRGETAGYQWYLLVNEACANANVPIDEMVKDYLATMLYRFMTRTELFDQLAAFDFYQYAFGTAKIDSTCVQDIADISLQYVAFFPERSYNRHQPRSMEYVANIGTDLYRGLAKSSEKKDDWFSSVFKLMATSFGSAVMVLRSTLPRFALQRALRQEKFHGEAMRFPTISEVMKLGPALNTFNRMYFQSENATSLKNN